MIEVGKFETYDELCKSKWANYNYYYYGEDLKAMYDDKYFKSHNLVMIAFNHKYKDLDIYV